MSLTYVVPTKPKKPFAKGDIVEVCSRDMKPMSESKVMYAGPRVVRTDCGRRWNQDGWWMNEDGDVYPFPSIRRKQK